MRARKRWKEAISSNDKLLLYVSPSPVFLLSPVPAGCLTSSDVDLQKLEMSCWHWKQQVIKAILTEKKPKPGGTTTNNNKVRTTQRWESERKRKKGKGEYVKVWFKVIKDTNSRSVDSRECQQVPSLYFNLLLLFFPSLLHSISTQLPTIWIEEGGDGRTAGQWTHPSTLCRQEAMQILAASLDPTGVQCLSMFGAHLQLSNNCICWKKGKEKRSNSF